MNLEPGKFYRTRGGDKARIYAVDGADDEVVHGAILYGDTWRQVCWFEDGTYLKIEEHLSDLIAEWSDEPKEFEAWVKGESITNGMFLNVGEKEGWRKVRVRIVE